MIAPADLRALGVSPCGCGAVYKRTSRPWGCGRKGCDDLGRGSASGGIPANARTASEEGDDAAGRTAHAAQALRYPAPSKPRAGKAAEDALAAALVSAGHEVIDFRTWLWRALDGTRFPGFVREFVVGSLLAEPRRFRADLFHPASRACIEMEGGAHGIQRQRRSDIVREQLLESAGLRVVRVLPEQVNNGEALALVRRAIGGAE